MKSILIFGVLFIAMYHIMHYHMEHFTDSPVENIKATETEEANHHYISLLQYLQKYPDKSVKFLDDIKTKFFKDCTVNDIDFKTIVEFPNGMVF